MSIKPIAMRDVLLDGIWQSMKENADIFIVSADFGSPVLDRIRRDFPERFINVGIAEQNLINVAAGLALEGFIVFAYAIAPFITMRCYEQIRVSLALLSEIRPMNVNLIGVGAGFSYVVSGPTHQCYEDITLIRALPNFQLLSPADHVTAGELLERCLKEKGPKYLRLDAQVLPVIYHEEPLNLCVGFHVHRNGADICIVATGYMLHTALEVADKLAFSGYEIGVIDLVDISRFDTDIFIDRTTQYKALVSMEEGFKGRGGIDSMLFDLITTRKLPLKMLNIGVEGGYSFELGTREELHEKVGIGPLMVYQIISGYIHSLKHSYEN
jgi:transketolase